MLGGHFPWAVAFRQWETAPSPRLAQQVVKKSKSNPDTKFLVNIWYRCIVLSMCSNSLRQGTTGWITVSPEDWLDFMNITALTLLKLQVFALTFNRWSLHRPILPTLQKPVCSSHMLPKARSGFAVSGLCHARGKDGVQLHSWNVMGASDLHPYSALPPALLDFLTMQEGSMLPPGLDTEEGCLIITLHR